MSPRRAAWAALVLLSTSASFAWGEPIATLRSAESAPRDRALADTLFRSGMELLKADRLEAACNQFEESQRLEPALGTLLYVATCHAQQGKTRTAWSEFSSAVELARRNRDAAREQVARQRRIELEAVLSKIALSISSPVPGMVISVDDRELSHGEWSTALPYDPGSHKLEATAPGRQPWVTTIVLDQGPCTRSITVPLLAEASAATSAEYVIPSLSEPRNSAVRPPASGFDWHPVGLVSLGAGIVGLAGAGYFGLRARAQASEADQFCTGNLCTQRGLDGHDTARRSAVYANIGFGVGMVGLIAGTYLLYTENSKTATGQRALWLRAGASQVTAGGDF